MAKKQQKYPRVPYGLSFHGPEEVRAVTRVVKGNTALGKETQACEEKIAKLYGKRFGIMVNSGSSANLLAIELLNAKKGSEVITPALTFATTVAPIVQKGLVPVFVDVDPKSFLIDMEQVKKAITKKTVALMIPSLIGNVPDMIKLRSLARKHKLVFIEDSCDTFAPRFGGKPSGSYSDISTTSFYGSHIINGAGGGGIILVHDKNWANRLLVLRGWGRMSSLFGESKESEDIKRRFKGSIGSLAYDAKFIFSELAYNFLPLELSSAFLRVQLKKFPSFFKKREQNFKRLKSYIATKSEYFDTPSVHPRVRTAWLAYPVLIKSNAPFNRKELATFLENRNIQTRPIFTGNILKQPGFKKTGGKTPFAPYKGADYVMKHGMLIGCHQGLTKKQLDHMIKSIDVFLEKYA